MQFTASWETTSSPCPAAPCLVSHTFPGVFPPTQQGREGSWHFPRPAVLQNLLRHCSFSVLLTLHICKKHNPKFSFLLACLNATRNNAVIKMYSKVLLFSLTPSPKSPKNETSGSGSQPGSTVPICWRCSAHRGCLARLTARQGQDKFAGMVPPHGIRPLQLNCLQRSPPPYCWSTTSDLWRHAGRATNPADMVWHDLAALRCSRGQAGLWLLLTAPKIR